MIAIGKVEYTQNHQTAHFEHSKSNEKKQENLLKSISFCLGFVSIKPGKFWSQNKADRENKHNEHDPFLSLFSK